MVTYLITRASKPTFTAIGCVKFRLDWIKPMPTSRDQLDHFTRQFQIGSVWINLNQRYHDFARIPLVNNTYTVGQHISGFDHAATWYHVKVKAGRRLNGHTRPK